MSRTTSATININKEMQIGGMDSNMYLRARQKNLNSVRHDAGARKDIIVLNNDLLLGKDMDECD